MQISLQEYLNQSLFVSEVFTFCIVSLSQSDDDSLLIVTDVSHSPLNSIIKEMGSS